MFRLLEAPKAPRWPLADGSAGDRRAAQSRPPNSPAAQRRFDRFVGMRSSAALSGRATAHKKTGRAAPQRLRRSCNSLHPTYERASVDRGGLRSFWAWHIVRSLAMRGHELPS